jgi:hypothetical protein
MIRTLVFCSAAVFCFGLLVQAAPAADSTEYLLAERPAFSLGLGFDYETGDYGTGSDSDFLAVPLYLDLYPSDRLDFELIVPYVYLRTEDAGATTVFYRTSGGYASGAARGRNRPASGTDSTTTSETATSSGHASESGLGDITLTAGYILIEESRTLPQVRPSLYFKFPTADEDKGLGTGEFDYGPGLALGKWLGDWHLFAEGLFVVQGDSELYRTKDYFSFEGGIGHQFSANLYGAVQIRGATAPADGADDSLEGRIRGIWRLAPAIALEGYLGTGLNDGGADLTSSIAVFFDF